MKILTSESLTNSDVLALGIFDDTQEFYSSISADLSEEIKNSLKGKLLETAFGKIYHTWMMPQKDMVFKSVMLVGLGDKDSFDTEKLRRAMSVIVHYVRDNKYFSFTTNIASIRKMDPLIAGRSVAEGLLLADYSFEKYKSKKDKTSEITANIQYPSDTLLQFRQGIINGTIISNATNYAKDLVNEPANTATPVYLEQQAKMLAKKNVRMKVLHKSDLKKLGLNALLAVSSGSDHSPRLIILQYNGAKKEKYTAIVGKGITFDSGGYDIKPAGKFADMKFDMAGAAAVLGTIKAAAELGLKKNIIGVIPTCENLINGSAYKPGDIVKAYNGKTIEISNTDAEGRLILADALSYVEKNYSPGTIIDLATLTGACIIALGYYTSALYSNDKELMGKLVNAGDSSSDRVWPMPFYEDYQDLMDGDISDLKNMSRWSDHNAAGSITGAVFLSKFVDMEKTKWAHIDIAGTAFLVEDHYYNQKYATGAGVRLLTYYFMG